MSQEKYTKAKKSDPRPDYSSYFTSGSAAPEIRPLQIPVDMPAAVPKRRPKEQHVGHKLKLVATIFMIFGCCMVLMMGHASIVYQQRLIKNLQSELKEVEDQNNMIRTEIAESIDIQVVEQRAKEDLGMIKPGKHQIIYIDVPKQNYAVHYETDSAQENSQKIGISAFLGFLNKGR